MYKVAIITDSSCDLPQSIRQMYDIFVAPLRIIYKQREYLDGVEISPAEVVARLEDEIPKTSLPSPQSLQNIVEEVVQKGYDRAVGIFMSSGLSGTYNMARQIFDEEKRIESKVFDSKSLSLELGFVVCEMARLVKNELDWSLYETTFERIRAKTLGLFTIDTLKYLQVGGRIGRVESAIGELLHVKPIISPNREDGVYYTYKKVRGRKKSIHELINVVDSYAPKKISVGLVHADALDEVNQMKEDIDARSHATVTMISEISPALVVHGGPGLIGLICQEI